MDEDKCQFCDNIADINLEADLMGQLFEIPVCAECFTELTDEDTPVDEADENLIWARKEIDKAIRGGAGHHLNVNVLNREKLIEAMEDPERHPLLVVRVSGYAISFNRLSREQQEEVISRTFHDLV